MPRDDLYDDRKIGANYCQSHCVTCGVCFAEQTFGDEDEAAYAAHIKRHDDGSIEHIDPAESKHLQVRTYKGYCRLMNPEGPVTHPVTIWEHAEAADRGRERHNK